jgi:predicted GIY-YIG superfamily endonuclease
MTLLRGIPIRNAFRRSVTPVTDSPTPNQQSPDMPKLYCVYILASQRRVLYIGMTSNIEHRVFQHKTHTFVWIHRKIQRHHPRAFRTLWLSIDRDSSRERTKSLAAGRENPSDRIREPQMARPKLRMVPTTPLSTRPQSDRTVWVHPHWRDVILRRAIALRRTRRSA